MLVSTIAGNEITFLFESSSPEHEQYMQQIKTGYRGKPYTVTSNPVELPDAVANYAIDNNLGVELYVAVRTDSCQSVTARGDVCGRDLPCHYHTEAE